MLILRGTTADCCSAGLRLRVGWWHDDIWVGLGIEDEGKRQGQEPEDQREQDCQAIEVSFNAGRSGRRGTETTAEHIGQAATASAVEQNQGQQCASDYHIQDSQGPFHDGQRTHFAINSGGGPIRTKLRMDSTTGAFLGRESSAVGAVSTLFQRDGAEARAASILAVVSLGMA